MKKQRMFILPVLILALLLALAACGKGGDPADTQGGGAQTQEYTVTFKRGDATLGSVKVKAGEKLAAALLALAHAPDTGTTDEGRKPERENKEHDRKHRKIRKDS